MFSVYQAEVSPSFELSTDDEGDDSTDEDDMSLDETTLQATITLIV